MLLQTAWARNKIGSFVGVRHAHSLLVNVFVILPSLLRPSFPTVCLSHVRLSRRREPRWYHFRFLQLDLPPGNCFVLHPPL